MACLGRILLVALCAACFHLLTADAVAEETNLVPTRINAERMEFDYEDGVIYLRGHVVVRDVEGTIAADNATVYLERDTPDSDPQIADADDMLTRGGGSFARVVAVGNVKIIVDERSAISNKAVWDRTEETIVLSGGPPMLREGVSYIRATRIVFHTDTHKCDFYPNPEVVFQVSDEDRDRLKQ
jgi:lipopolysaccharide export system protein LptA